MPGARVYHVNKLGAQTITLFNILSNNKLPMVGLLTGDYAPLLVDHLLKQLIKYAVVVMVKFLLILLLLLLFLLPKLLLNKYSSELLR